MHLFSLEAEQTKSLIAFVSTTSIYEQENIFRNDSDRKWVAGTSMTLFVTLEWAHREYGLIKVFVFDMPSLFI